MLIYARPAEGLSLPLPDGRPWPADGDFVDTADAYVRRRLADGDIVEAAPPAAPADTGAGEDAAVAATAATKTKRGTAS